MTTPVWLDELTPEELDVDPYPVWARMRAETPVAYVPWAGLWFVTRWDDCIAVGKDTKGFRGARDHPTLDRVFGPGNVLTSVDPVHGELREAIDPIMAPKAVNQFVEALVKPIVDRHLAGLYDRGAADIMTEYFEPVGVEALGELMGLGVDPPTLRRWFHGLNAGISNIENDPSKFAASDRIAEEIEGRLDPLIDRLTADPDDSMLSRLIHGGRNGKPPRTAAEVYPSLKVILLGGMQEPGHAAGSALLGLFGKPDQLAAVIEDPELIPDAISEGLRWIAPIGAVERQATAEIKIGGCTIAEGDIVEIVLGSANRDETRFERADEFDMDREAKAHMAFGNGEHFCSGHFFARQLERIAFEGLLEKLIGLRLDPGREPEVRGWAFRAPKTMHVLWDTHETSDKRN